MGLHKRKLNRTGKVTSVNQSLKKLGVEKTGKSNNETRNDIIIDVKSPSKAYDDQIEFAVRKLSQSEKSQMPRDLKPMLATLSDEPFNDAAWQFELKLDGYRTLAY